MVDRQVPLFLHVSPVLLLEEERCSSSLVSATVHEALGLPSCTSPKGAVAQVNTILLWSVFYSGLEWLPLAGSKCIASTGSVESLDPRGPKDLLSQVRWFYTA